jgi:hypothetical protein
VWPGGGGSMLRIARMSLAPVQCRVLLMFNVEDMRSHVCCRLRPLTRCVHYFGSQVTHSRSSEQEPFPILVRYVWMRVALTTDGWDGLSFTIHGARGLPS